MSTTEVRRSKRENKGIPPSKYTEGSRHEEKERSKVPSKSKKTNTSSLRRKKLQAELEAEKQLAEISRQELEIQKKLIQKELKESLLLMEELNLGENETELLNMDLEKIRIQQWINNIPSVHTFADKSISFSSRSGRAESFEVVKEVPEVEGMYSVKMSKVNPEKNKDVQDEGCSFHHQNGYLMPDVQGGSGCQIENKPIYELSVVGSCDQNVETWECEGDVKTIGIHQIVFPILMIVTIVNQTLILREIT
ncbi:hypothetical protein JTB14_036278 [Gonioctena quinquepunctata]|nr:hypothetical protein JTB14_036278 [Gonioctena quinquepunctata]